MVSDMWYKLNSGDVQYDNILVCSKLEIKTKQTNEQRKISSNQNGVKRTDSTALTFFLFCTKENLPMAPNQKKIKPQPFVISCKIPHYLVLPYVITTLSCTLQATKMPNCLFVMAGHILFTLLSLPSNICLFQYKALPEPQTDFTVSPSLPEYKVNITYAPLEHHYLCVYLPHEKVSSFRQVLCPSLHSLSPCLSKQTFNTRLLN